MRFNLYDRQGIGVGISLQRQQRRRASDARQNPPCDSSRKLSKEITTRTARRSQVGSRHVWISSENGLLKVGGALRAAILFSDQTFCDRRWDSASHLFGAAQ
jgi:hypothetical protein